MSITYYMCPYCYVRTSQSYLGREYRYCSQCGHTFDLDDTDPVTLAGPDECSEAARKAVTVGQSHTGGEFASHCQRRTGVGPSTARSGGTS